VADRRDQTRQKERASSKYTAKKAASERLAAERAAQRRAARKRNILVVGSSIVAVIAVVAVIIVVAVNGSGSGKSGDSATGNAVVPASAAVTDALVNVPATADNLNFNKLVSGPPSKISGSALTGKDGLPQVLYVGAEFCPYCAATRWPLAVALGRFGTFTDLKTTYSADDDSAGPHTPTLSFQGATYSSPYLDFVGVEHADGVGNPLEPLTDEQDKLFSSIGGSSYPFIDFGGVWMQRGASFDPKDLGGMTPDQVAQEIGDTSSDVGKTIQAGADVFTAIICQMNGAKPANVCTAPGVKAAEAALNAGS
jgi:hypothetical protein